MLVKFILLLNSDALYMYAVKKWIKYVETKW